MSIEDFSTKLKGIWDELDALDPIVSSTCSGCEFNLPKRLTKANKAKD